MSGAYWILPKVNYRDLMLETCRDISNIGRKHAKEKKAWKKYAGRHVRGTV
jgi:hypothetical protein